MACKKKIPLNSIKFPLWFFIYILLVKNDFFVDIKFKNVTFLFLNLHAHKYKILNTFQKIYKRPV